MYLINVTNTSGAKQGKTHATITHCSSESETPAVQNLLANTTTIYIHAAQQIAPQLTRGHTDQQTLLNQKNGGATQIRTGDQGVADPRLTTWLWRLIT